MDALRKDSTSSSEIAQLLDDPEPFVVAKALEVLGSNNMAPTVALIRTADRHPSLAPTVIKMLVEHKEERPAAAKYLHEFAKHADPAVRAAAISGLAEVAPEDCQAEILQGLDDDSSKVRIAAAHGVFELLDGEWPKRFKTNDGSGEGDVNLIQPPAASVGPFSRLSRLLGHSGATPETPNSASADAAAKNTTEPSDAISTNGPAKPVDIAAVPEESPAPTINARDTPESANKALNDVDPAVAKGAAVDEWLSKHRQGETRGDWLAKAIQPLKRMTKADTAEERVAAAKALVPLGDDGAASLLQSEVFASPSFVPELAGTLHWLASEKRTQVFEKLLPVVRSNARSLRELLEAMGEIRDQSSIQAVWRAVEQTDDLADGSLSTAFYTARNVYFPQGVFHSGEDDSSARLKQYSKQVESLKPRAATGSEAERLLALVLLSEIDQPTAGSLADSMLGDATLSRKMRGKLVPHRADGPFEERATPVRRLQR